jgi:hypothetical protein
MVSVIQYIKTVVVLDKAVSSAGLRPKSDCSGKAQTKLYGVSAETAK